MSTDTMNVRLEAETFPCDRLRIRTLSGREAISELFTFELDVVCLDRGGVSVEAMASARTSLVFERDGLEVRRVHGMITEIEDRLASDADHRSYRMRLAPRAFRLTLTELQDICMGLSVPEIIEQKLRLVDLLSGDFQFRTRDKYAPREFVVQYKETDLAFVSRLAEHLGISFFFEHEGDADKIVFTDHEGGFSRLSEPERVVFRERGEHRDVFELRALRRLVPSLCIVQDYNYRQPLVPLAAEHEVPLGFAGGAIEYGSHFKTPEEGAVFARIRAEEKQASALVYSGKSTLPALTAGATFRLEGHPDLEPTDLLVTAVEHHLRCAGAGDGEKEGYTNTFQAVPATTTYRPARVTPRPRIAGLVTAVIDPGPSSAHHAWLDGEGRYLVRFLFDPNPRGDRPVSRPVRMAQPFVGANHGIHFPLKPGVEVVVGFIDGDPDRPIIVGAVPNPLTPSPVNNKNPRIHRMRTASGVRVDMVDDA